MDLKVHCHNTFGLATANTLACAEGGGTELDCCINGYGEEAGNASLEEVAVSLEALYGVDTGLNLSLLNTYSKIAAEKGHMPIQPHKAVVGENAFLRPMLIWSGVNMAKESWMLHEPLDPDCVGATSTVVFGPAQSLEDEPIEVKFKELGIPCTPQKIVQAREATRRQADRGRVRLPAHAAQDAARSRPDPRGCRVRQRRRGVPLPPRPALQGAAPADAGRTPRSSAAHPRGGAVARPRRSPARGGRGR